MKRCCKCGGIFDNSKVTLGLCGNCMVEHLFETADSVNAGFVHCMVTSVELNAYIKKWGNRAPVWIEYRSSKWGNRAILKSGSPDFEDLLYHTYYIEETIGIEWRAWCTKPTNEQRYSVKWLDKVVAVVTEPCPLCGAGDKPLVFVSNNSGNPEIKFGYYFTSKAVCPICGENVRAPGVYYCEQDAKDNAIRIWNRRSKELRRA